MKTPAERLRALVSRHQLTQRDVAALGGVSLKTVESWLAAPESANHRTMPERALLLIKLSLPAFLKRRARVKE